MQPATLPEKDRMMFMLKSCPRCHGDLNGYPEDGLSCIQCGYELKPQEQQRLLLQLQMERQRTPVGAGR